LPAQRLTWHYRSRHESLISFSNRRYYDGELVTFPSVWRSEPRLGVSWRDVRDGVYDRAGQRTNRREAEMVVEEIVRRLLDPAERSRSIGVVTFNLAQEMLIENLLDEACRRHPEIEPYFTDAVDEPVFVKNLETVQGDERDVMLFSIGYGPDADGRVSMNFGPLNAKGGERRLNVAVTRAREQLIVFSALRPEHIDLSRTQATGVAHLKDFLAFAARGGGMAPGSSARAGDDAGEAGDSESFVESIEKALADKGWSCDRHVGASEYRIDLAVKHPSQSGLYVLGIEVDGPMYGRTRTARDRDRLRPDVLANQGWRLVRVWAPEWQRDADGQLAKIEKALAIAMADREAGRIRLSSVNATPRAAGDEDPSGNPAAGTGATEAPAREPDAPVRRSPSNRSHFKAVAPDRISEDPEELYARPGTVRTRIREILSAEAPIQFRRLAREVLRSWSATRLTERAETFVREQVEESGGLIRSSETGDFVWTAKLREKGFTGYRANDPASHDEREPDEICPEEWSNAARDLLSEHLGMSIEELCQQTAHTLGFKATAGVRQHVRNALQLLTGAGFCREEGDRICLVD
jgi:very-short-patch-repair endonuclease